MLQKLQVELLIITFLFGFTSFSQEGIGTSNPNKDAVLELYSKKKGFLVPRIELTATNLAAPLSAHVKGMLIYNTATSGTIPNNVTPGYYYNDGVRWSRISSYSQIDMRLLSNDNHLTSDAGNGFNGTSLGTGLANIAINRGSLRDNTTGSNNVAIGKSVLRSNTTGNHNIGIGTEALSNAASSNNIGIGSNTLIKTTGQHNIAIGSINLTENTTGASNISIGTSSMNKNTTGSSNVNVGIDGLNKNTIGKNNIALGTSSLSTNTKGNNNIAIGNAAMGHDNTTRTEGDDNIAIGYNSMYKSTAGNRNISLGNEVLYNNTTGSDNISLGSNSLKSNTDGKNNIALGKDALLNSKGNNNIALGQNISQSLTGNGNFLVGLNVNVPNASQSNQLNILNRIIGSQNGFIGIGNIIPTEKLDVNGKVKIRTLDEKVLDRSLKSFNIIVNENGVLEKESYQLPNPKTLVLQSVTNANNEISHQGGNSWDLEKGIYVANLVNNLTGLVASSPGMLKIHFTGPSGTIKNLGGPDFFLIHSDAINSIERRGTIGNVIFAVTKKTTVVLKIKHLTSTNHTVSVPINAGNLQVYFSRLR